MPKLSRRHLVAGGLAGAGASLLPAAINEAQAATFTRYNLASANGQIMLKKYAQAVKLMMALPPSNPLSWTFQWYTHAVPSNTSKAAQLTAIFGPNPSPNKTLATAMWDTCQAHFNPADEPYFLPWHRMFLCFFEEIIRAVLKDPKFTLPYWNYSVPAGYPLPKEFRLQNDQQWGSLFRASRNPTSNAGQPIFNFNNGSPSDLNPASALAQGKYLPTGTAVPGFNLALDQGVHGAVHVFVGNTTGMGRIPWAANDPIFWMHHCNIDRIWVSWNTSHGNPNTSAWLGKSFVFAGPDGKQVTPVVRDYTNTKKCDYQYDQLIGAAPLVAASDITSFAVAAESSAPALTLAKSAGGPVQLGDGPTRANVQAAAPPPPGTAQGAAPLAAQVQALPENRRLYLVLNNIKADAPPETLYRVYLDLPEGPLPDDPVNSNYVGSFNFFDAVPHGDQRADHGSKPVSFDITSVVSNLQARGRMKVDHTVTIVPAGKPAADAKPVVGDISFVEQ